MIITIIKMLLKITIIIIIILIPVIMIMMIIMINITTLKGRISLYNSLYMPCCLFSNQF